jgi:hypothetical protein
LGARRFPAGGEDSERRVAKLPALPAISISDISRECAVFGAALISQSEYARRHGANGFR